jgi:hypothetical protein
VQRHAIVTSPGRRGGPFRPRLAVIGIPDLTDPRQIVRALVLSRQPFTLTNGAGGWQRWKGREVRLVRVRTSEIPRGTPEVAWTDLVDEALAEERAGRSGPQGVMDGPGLLR